jgi:hypothetical protein
MHDTIHTTSLLKYLLSLLTKNDSEKEKKEIERYDNIKFVDASKEIKNQEKKNRAVKAH